MSLACAVVEGATGGFDTIRSAELQSLADLIYVEGLIWTGTAPATPTGNAAGNLLQSLSAGADTIDGREGNDTLDGGAGADRLVGGTGDDTVSGGNGMDRVIGGAGVDRVVGGAGDDTLSGGATQAGADFRLDLGDGAADRLDGGAGNDTIAGFWIAGQAPLGGDGDTLAGGAGNDVLVALRGLTMQSGAAVALFGGSGDDLYVLSDTGDYVGWDASGTDQVLLIGPVSGSSVDLSGLRGVEVINMAGGTGLAAVLNPAPFAAASTAAVGVAELAGQPIGTLPADWVPQNLLANADATLIYGNLFENEITALGGNDTVIGVGGRTRSTVALATICWSPPSRMSASSPTRRRM